MKEEKVTTEKKNYNKPELSLYGDIHQLTQANPMGKGAPDGVFLGRGKAIKEGKTG